MKSQVYLFNIAWVDRSSEAHLSAVHYVPLDNVMRVTGSNGLLVNIRYANGQWCEAGGSQTWLTAALGNRITKKFLKTSVSDTLQSAGGNAQIDHPQKKTPNANA
jgi:hypothetical protein